MTSDLNIGSILTFNWLHTAFPGNLCNTSYFSNEVRRSWENILIHLHWWFCPKSLPLLSLRRASLHCLARNSSIMQVGCKTVSKEFTDNCLFKFKVFITLNEYSKYIQWYLIDNRLLLRIKLLGDSYINLQFQRFEKFFHFYDTKSQKKTNQVDNLNEKELIEHTMKSLIPCIYS